MIDPDEAWARRAQQGDQKAFDVLDKKYRNQIVAYCVRQTMNRQDGEDAAQEAFARAWRGLPGFHGSYFSHWLQRIATNACIDLLQNRRRKQNHEIPLDDAPEMAALPVENELDMLDQYEAEVFRLAKTTRRRWDELDMDICQTYFENLHENLCRGKQSRVTLREVALRLNKNEDLVRDRFRKRIGPILQAARQKFFQK